MPAWLDALEDGAPDAVAAYRTVEDGRPLSVRREVRRRTPHGSTDALVEQLGATAGALGLLVSSVPAGVLSLPGGEEDWNVAQTVGHVAHARVGLVLAASLAAGGRWPGDAPRVVPGVPGVADADRRRLVARIEQSQRLVERAARAVAGHELAPCPLDHPLVGRLRCGEWLLFAAVHDLMHLGQLHEIAGRGGSEPRSAPRRTPELGARSPAATRAGSTQ